MNDVKIFTEFETTYVPHEDVTIIWQNMYKFTERDGGELIQRALVGWYCGEPDKETTKHYTNMPTIGQFL